MTFITCLTRLDMLKEIGEDHVSQFHLYFTSSFRASRFTLIFLAHGMEKLTHKNGKSE